MEEIVADALRQQRLSAVLVAGSRSARCCWRLSDCSASCQDPSRGAVTSSPYGLLSAPIMAASFVSWSVKVHSSSSSAC
jgi:hypothetical protein